MFGLLSNRHADRTSRSPCGRFVFRSRTWPPTRRPAVARTHQGQTFGAVIDGQTSAASCHRRVDGFLWGALVPFSNCVSLVQYISYNWRTIYILLQSIYMTIYTIIIWSNLCHTFRTSDPSQGDIVRVRTFLIETVSEWTLLGSDGDTELLFVQPAKALSPPFLISSKAPP